MPDFRIPLLRDFELQLRLTRRPEGARTDTGKVGALTKTHTNVNPANMVWILGSARTGSSWLARMLRDLQFTLWDEPLIGEVFGSLRGGEARFEAQRKRKDFALSNKRNTSDSVRNFILDNAASRFPNASHSTAIVVKEPHAAAGAPTIMQALPEAGMIWLMRDPRDVAASGIDAHKPGAWSTHHKTNQRTQEALGAARQRARMYTSDMEAARIAYEAHSGPKSFVRYEDLRSQPTTELPRILSELGHHRDEKKIAAAIATEDWDTVPKNQKGPGKSKRKATPGGWQEDLTPEQVQIVESIAQPFIGKFYS